MAALLLCWFSAVAVSALTEAIRDWPLRLSRMQTLALGDFRLLDTLGLFALLADLRLMRKPTARQRQHDWNDSEPYYPHVACPAARSPWIKL